MTSGELIYSPVSSVFCDDLKRRGKGVEGGSRGGRYLYLQVIHIVVQQKPIQHCKGIILQIKIK